MSDHISNTRRIRVDRAKLIPRTDKEKYLGDFKEDQFRDLVIRRVFDLRGFLFERETHGQSEEGKDQIFTLLDPLGVEQVYAVQAKRGPLTLASTASENIVTAITQLRTALETEVVVGRSRRKVKPDCVLLCASGRINEPARRHIATELRDNRIRFMDANELIPQIDELCPEFWYGIDADKMPYFEKLKTTLLHQSDTISIPDTMGEAGERTPISDHRYVPLSLQHITTKVVKQQGAEQTEPELEEVHISELLDKPEGLVLIVGEGGSGKTTALRRVAYTIIETGLKSLEIRTVPVLLRATDLLQSDKRLVELAGDHTAAISKKGTHAFSATELAAGKVTLLIDALDEIAIEQQRARVVSRILEFNKAFPKCKVIVTSRDYSFTKVLPGLAGFNKYYLNPIDIRQALKIAEAINKDRSLPKEAIKEMLRRLQDVHGISLNPLLVTVFVATTDVSRKDIPANITEIFKKFSELMLGRWDEKKGLSQQYHAPLKDFLLQRLALRMHCDRVTSLPIRECRALFESELKARGHEASTAGLFEEVMERSGLLRIEGENIEFRHHLLQEFFAGRAIPSIDQLRVCVSDDWWRKPVVFFFGANPERIDVLQELTTCLDSSSHEDRLNASITIGLSLQACYLSEVEKKDATLEWVIQELAAKHAVPSADATPEQPRPLSHFVGYYLFGRDAVACDLIRGIAKRLVGTKLKSEGVVSAELRDFWCIVGLLEAGHLDDAEELLKKFKPNDLRLLMAIDLGCFFISHLRISSDEHRKIAKRMHEKISPKVAPFVEAVHKEFKSFLLEVRRGQVQALKSPENPPEGA